MTITTVTTPVKAPIEVIFKAISDPSVFVEKVPHITKVEFLTEHKTGKGTKFRETRIMHGKEHSTELEITEYVENEQVRMVADSHGTVWDTLFTLEKDGDNINIVLEMEARAYKLLSKIMNLLIKGVVKKAIIEDMQAVKTYCENKNS